MTTPNNENSKPQVDPVIINGPVVPAGSGPIYQVTLATGAVLTNPAAFPHGGDGKEVNPYVAEDGRLLI
jgi:hypothetical protein